MDYDLDSLLNSQLSSDDDDDDDEDDNNGDTNSSHHRTIDEILNDSDSSASPSSSPPPDRRIRPSAPKFSSDSSTDGGPKFARSEESLVGSRSSSLARLKSGETAPASSPEDFLRRTSKPLPFLFASVRSNAKPGAALAAAAAASRSVPSPHAAAIKSRRISVGRDDLGKVLDVHGLCSDSNGDSSSVSAKSAEDSKVNGKADALPLSSVPDICGEGLRSDETVESSVEAEHEIQGSLEVSVETQADSILENSLKDVDFDETFDAESRNRMPDSTSADENASETDKSSKLVDTGDGSELVCSTSSAPTTDINHSSESTEDLLNPELETGVSPSNDDEDINELVEERIGHLESKRVSERAEKKKSRPRMKPLELAEELEKKHASTGLHWEEGAAAQPMRLEGVRRGSIALGYFEVDANNVISRILSSQPFRRDYGSPQVLAVHANYIAVGMARGVIVVVPSKYSAHKADEMDSKMIMLGLQGERTYAAVTAICFNQQGDLLLAGYGDGHITLWDMQRSSAAKVMTGEHTAPVVHALFIGQDSQATRQFKAVTGDTKGLVTLHNFSVVPLFNRFSDKTICLLDGQRTGTVLSASPLLFDEFPGVVGGDVGRKLPNEGSSLVEEGVVIFVTHQNALVVRLGPNMGPYAQLTRLEGVREGSMPYTAWKCTTQSQKSTNENGPNETLEQVSLLAIAWDRKVQVAKLANSELKVYGKWSLDSAAIGVAWLDDQMLVILTVNGQLYLCGNDGTVIHQTSFAVDGAAGDDLVSYHSHFNNIFGNPEKAYHNCVAVRGASIYILGQAHLIVSRLLPWKERIQALRKGGDWMGSLNMAMTIYDGQAHGVVDLPRTLDAVHEAIMPYLVELLLAYVEEVFSYISVAFCNQIEKMDQLDQPSSKSSSVHHEIKEQYTRVGGVAVEFCVHIKKTDILFDEIYPKFLTVKQKETFLELLEPYILRDMLGSLPPEIMQALVEHYSSKGWLQRVEQCVLHMDISSLDFNQVVKLCQEHGLYGALIYLFNKGLDDFRAPLEELLAVLQNSQGEAAAALGYRILVYLKYCFSGLSFPPGHGKLQTSRLPSLREELLRFMLENSATLSSKAGSSPSSRGENLKLYLLLELDTEATLDVLRCAFEEAEVVPQTDSTQKSADTRDAKRNSISTSQSPYLLVQNTVDALINILNKEILQSDGSSVESGGESVKGWLSKKEIGYLYEFIAHYVAREKANVSKRVLSQMVEYLTSEDFASSESEQGIISKRREKQVLALLKVAPETAWDASYVLQLCEKAHFYQVCGMIHKLRCRYLAALDSYVKDVDEPIHAFSFIYSTLLKLSDNDRTAFQLAVINRISELVELNREGTFFLVVDQFNHEVSHILSELRTHPKSLFLYLKTAVEVHLTGSLSFGNLRRDGITSLKDNSEELEAYFGRISDFPKLLRNNPINVTDEMIELYLELLCQYEPDSVLKFLETFDSYRVEHCLRLCQEHGIIDAASFLLERVGDVGSALLLTLSSLNNKFSKLADSVGSGTTGVEHFRSTKNLEVKEIKRILNACIGLCQRNTPRLNPEESEMLWFRLLDSFCEPLMGAFGDEKSSEGGHLNGIWATTLGQQDDENKESIIKWRIPRSHKRAHILKKLFSQFIMEIVEGMIGYVRLPTIMSKLLADNGSQEFGDFKPTILGMLGTYDFERRILDTAKSLIEDDTYYTMSLLKKGAVHGYAPRAQTCCICNGLLTKIHSSSSVRVFNCGHATHLQCEALESSTSSLGSSSGCPICIPSKKTERSRNKSVLVDNGLVKKFMSRPHQAHGATFFQHDMDSLDYTYGVQQISRFEMLNMLQKDQRLAQVENVPQLRLAPPAVYHEKVKKGNDIFNGESSMNNMARTDNRNKQLKDLKVRGAPSLRFPLKSNIFGKEKMSKR